MNKCITFIALIMPFFLCGMDQKEKYLDEKYERIPHDYEFNTFFKEITSSVTDQEKPESFLKNVKSKKPKIEYIDPNEFRVLENSEVVYTGQVFDWPAPNINGSKGNRKFALTESLDHHHSMINHMIEIWITRDNNSYNNNNNNNENNIKQAYDF